MIQFGRRTRAFAAALTLSALVASPVSASSPFDVVLDGLDNPRGVDVGANGRVLVAETGAGTIWSIWKGEASPLVEDLPVLVTPEGALGVHGVSAVGSGDAFASIGAAAPGEPGRRLIRVLPHKTRDVADIGTYQAVDIDPFDQDGDPADSNPYGVASLGDGSVLVTDAGNNDLLLVDGSGSIETVARFPLELVTTSHLPCPLPFPFPPICLPPVITAEAVPTSVAVGPDGYWYVGELKGFPFAPGSARIWRIAPWARDVTCDPTAATPECASYLTGFTNVIDVDFGPDGSLYVLEMARSGLFAAFLGIDPFGALWKVQGGTRTQLVEGALVLPGGVGVGKDGAIYVTVGSIFADGALVKLNS